MKVAFVLSKCRRHGSSKNVLEVGSRLAAAGNEVHVFANSCDQTDGIRFHKVPSAPGYLANELLTTLWETVALRFSRFDVTVAQAGRYFSPDICHARFLTGAAVDIAEANGRKAGVVARLPSLPEGYGFRKAKRVIAMSESVKKDIINRYGIPAEKITVVYDGVDLSQFDPVKKAVWREEIRGRHNLAVDEVVLVFAGNPFSRKGLEYLIRALPLVKAPVKLFVIGKDDITPYLAIAEELGVADRVILVGFTTEVNKYFAASDAFVFPTLYEPFGLVVTEAMASGLPVITSRIAGSAELIEDGRNGLLLNDPKDSREIAEKIAVALSSKEMGKTARKRVESLTWEKTAADMFRVFEDVSKVK